MTPASASSFPCGHCKLEVVEGIKCSVCRQWSHRKCAKLGAGVFRLYCEERRLIWVCNGCRDVARRAVRGTTKADVLSQPKRASIVNSATPDQVVGKTGVRLRIPSNTNTRTALPSFTADVPVTETIKNKKKKNKNRTRDTKLLPKANMAKPPPPSVPQTLSTISHNAGKLTSNKAFPRLEVDQLTHLVNDCVRSVKLLKGEVNELRMRYDRELGRNRNILIHGYPEHSSRVPHVRKKANEALVLTVLRNAGMLHNVRWRRIHRVGRWTPTNSQRPLLVEFRSQSDRDKLLARLPQVYAGIAIHITITPDVPAIDSNLNNRQPAVVSDQANSAPAETLPINNSEITSTMSKTLASLNLKDCSIQTTEVSLGGGTPFRHGTQSTSSDYSPPAPSLAGSHVNTPLFSSIPAQVESTKPTPTLLENRLVSPCKSVVVPRRATRSVTRKNALVPRGFPPRDASI